MWWVRVKRYTGPHNNNKKTYRLGCIICSAESYVDIVWDSRIPSIALERARRIGIGQGLVDNVPCVCICAVVRRDIGDVRDQSGTQFGSVFDRSKPRGVVVAPTQLRCRNYKRP